MNSLLPELMSLDLTRASIPVRLLPAAAVACQLLQTEPGAALTLQSTQKFCTDAKLILPTAERGLSKLPYESPEPWAMSVRMGFKLARRQSLLSTFVARVQFQRAFLAESKLRPTMRKPYDLFAVWFLFVRAHPVEVPDKAYISAIGRIDLEQYIVEGMGDPSQCAESAAVAIFEAMADLDESGVSVGK